MVEIMKNFNISTLTVTVPGPAGSYFLVISLLVFKKKKCIRKEGWLLFTPLEGR
jgi:hypothetical protein